MDLPSRHSQGLNAHPFFLLIFNEANFLFTGAEAEAPRRREFVIGTKNEERRANNES